MPPEIPSDNLPYLFTAFGLAWVVFFAYVFFVSRQQREMEREIEELKQALATGENPGESLTRSSD